MLLIEMNRGGVGQSLHHCLVDHQCWNPVTHRGSWNTLTPFLIPFLSSFFPKQYNIIICILHYYCKSCVLCDFLFLFQIFMEIQNKVKSYKIKTNKTEEQFTFQSKLE